jgi:endonuclease-8
MPEGDTLFRAARAMHRALGGGKVRRFESQLAQPASVGRELPLEGAQIERVEARGKHHLIAFSGGWTLRTHMRMSGSWHLYRPGEKWQRAPGRARIVIETEAWVAVAFDVYEAELLSEEQLRRHPRLRRLGPDLLAPDHDEAEALRRLRGRPELSIADALLNQSLVAGAGNVFKSEVMFLAGVFPFQRVGETANEKLEELLRLARKLLQANVVEHAPDGIVTYTGLRRTTGRADPGERLWVYGRVHQPCRRCGTPIELERRGEAARSTYFCPRCQSPGARGSSWSN